MAWDDIDDGLYGGDAPLDAYGGACAWAASAGETRLRPWKVAKGMMGCSSRGGKPTAAIRARRRGS